MRVEKSLLFVFVFIFLGIYLMPLISAVDICADDQRIMRLSSAANAHGSNYTSNYIVEICYNKIFDSPYVRAAGENPHLCKTGNSNLVLKLSDTINAHGGNASSSYTIPVCYGNLTCRSTTGNCNTNTGERLIVSLSDWTNAHLANSSVNGYGLKICCKPSGLSPPPGTTCDSDGQCEANENCACSDCLGWENSCDDGQICSELITPSECSLYINPSIAIIKPAVVEDPDNWPKYKVSERVLFEQISKGTRDLNVTWNFGNGSSKTFTNCLTGGNCNTSGNYTQQAHYAIIAVAMEKRFNGNFAVNKTDILVYKEGINVFAVISRPLYNERIEAGDPVYFNANKSFVANCSLTCLAPTGISCYEVGSAQNKLNCYNLPTPAATGYKLWFEWTFDGGTDNQEILIGNWNQNYSTVVEFNKVFNIQGQHYASLRVGYEA